MILAAAMSASAQGVFFTIATILFVVAALLVLAQRSVAAALVPLGLAFFVFVYAWNAWAAS